MAVLAPSDPQVEPGTPGRGADPPAAPAAPVAAYPDRPAPVDDGPAVADGGPRRGNPLPEGAVAAMFDRIAPVYDRLNTVLTLRADGRWRRAAVDAAGLGPGGRAIDVASGTGKLAAGLAERVGPFGHVLGVDLSPAMVACATAANADLVQVEFRQGNALALPVPDAAFDAATIAFGLRNLADFEGGFRELRRVVRTGGRVVCLELAVPAPRPWGRFFQAAFRRIAPLAGRLAGSADAYRYLPASLDGFPDPDALAGSMRAAGLANVTFRRLGLGSVTLHVGTVPER